MEKWNEKQSNSSTIKDQWLDQWNFYICKMPVSPYKIKSPTLEELILLRTQVCKAYYVCRKEELKTPNNKNSVYYEELQNEIKKATTVILHVGTLNKFFNDDENLNYEVQTLEAIGEFIDHYLAVKTAQPEVNSNSQETRLFANRIYIELKTRKAAILIDEDKDVIEEVYDSWYELFCVIRDELKIFPVTNVNDIEDPESPEGLAMKILNEVLRPHLTEHQAKYRSWLETARKSPKNRNLTPQELQRKYPDYNKLMQSIQEVNKKLASYSTSLILQ